MQSQSQIHRRDAESQRKKTLRPNGFTPCSLRLCGYIQLFMPSSFFACKDVPANHCLQEFANLQILAWVRGARNFSPSSPVFFHFNDLLYFLFPCNILERSL